MGWLDTLLGRNTPEPLPEHALLLDVRRHEEFERGHIEGATLVPLDSLLHWAETFDGNRKEPVVVYCQSGMRSTAARRILLSVGFTYVIDGGGISALKRRMEETA